MKLLKAITIEGDTEFFNPSKILTYKPNQDGTRVKILMGAGLYWWVERESLQIIDAGDNEISNILKGEF